MVILSFPHSLGPLRLSFVDFLVVYAHYAHFTRYSLFQLISQVNMPVELQASTESKEAPVDVSSLEKLINEESSKLNVPSVFIEDLASALQKRSTKHKFIVLVTEVKADEAINEDLSIKVLVGTVWDGDKDGYHHFKVDSASTFMVTVYWIYVG